MSPHAARLFFGCSISFLLGGAAGVFALRTLYGDVDRVDPVPPRRLECPPPPPCPACPPPVDCGELGRIPAEPEGVMDDPGAPPTDLPPPADGAPPGLPASVIAQAQAAVRAAVAPCLESLVDPIPGVALLRFTVRAASGRGSVGEVLVTRATGGAADIEACLAEEAGAASFEWTGPDGQMELRLPIGVGAR